MSGQSSSDPASSDYQLTEEEVRILQEQRLLYPTPITNKRKVSVALLTPPQSDTSGSSSSSPSPSVRFRSFSSNLDRTFLIPSSIESVAALEFVGFTTDAAAQIFEWFSNKSSSNPNSLLTFARAHVATLARPEVEDMPIASALDLAGINSQIKAVFLKPKFDQVRQTQTLFYWVKDTITTNYNTLEHLQDRLKTSAKIGATKKQQKRSKISSTTFTPPTFAGPVATLSRESEVRQLSTIHTTTVETAPPLLPNHTALYKGKSSRELWDEWIQEDGSLYMPAIASVAKGDFNSFETAFYFSPERDTAEIYRQWAEERCEYSESWIIRVQLSDTFTETLSREDLWFGPDFREYVWRCRKGLLVPNKPSFDKYAAADLLVGHVARQPQLARMKPENVQTNFTEDMLVRINGGSTKSTQWALRYRTGERLAEEIKGNIYIEIFAPLLQQDVQDEVEKS
ncbi:hypothetical protein PTNB85_07736 [Pyrenophora teres f. teres]|uniref:Uncharacterized protein n=1 Tax=Pyrenophora teres f. teres TaxID=97479 RepID=A0A6S6W6V1_9PLEO|nr:hypothetical protein HRS9122_10095 [Pyrenophora teres f. teres]KAE8828549.1 hypothetical protein HRS9139_07768 [Pyrenophora teres f. teres]KAE8831149.1 hypothetical protein PTNB85_07736 [Pyrenophora teres f. teres]KAE8856850.1 hypothetical protein PTNB29_07917 [Pyrenophora teres f. teres]CAE7189369.1 hypothetical protein PTTW11_07466 [Pyrenophora teres f. teres]